MSRRSAEGAAATLPLGAEELRRLALARSQRRGQQVARRRLAWRWSLWALGRALRLGALPVALLGLGLALAWWLMTDDSAQRPAAALSAPAAAEVASATAAAADALPPVAPALPLRLDDNAELASPGAAHAQSETSQPTAVDRSSREQP